MKTYTELEAMQTEAYLNPDNFRTMYDGYESNNEYAQEQYDKGLRIGNEFDEIHISYKSVWSASNLDGRKVCHSCEGIGYHGCTAHLLKGFLDSTARIIVHRKWLDKPVVIKESTKVVAA